MQEITSTATEFGPVIITPDSKRYPQMVVGWNRRFVAAPESVWLVGNTEQVVRAVQEAVDSGKRISIRGGGHSYGDLVYHAEAEIILDMSQMNAIYYDRDRCAFAIESGALLMEIYETLFRGWGVTLPGGVCPSTGIAGHATGGGHGLLSRLHGNVSDLIEAVEIVVVDADGCARAVVACRDDTGALNDLWWACSGGGGGSFGVITRFWFRSRDAFGDDPEMQLPQPPTEVLIHTQFIPWAVLDEEKFANLLRNHGQWHVDNKHPDSPGREVAGMIFVGHVSGGGIGMLTQVDATVPGAEKLLDDYLAAVTAGTGVTGPFPRRRLGWWASTETVDTSNPTVMTNATLRSTVKAAYFRENFTDEQIAAIYRNMTRSDYQAPPPGAAVLQLGAIAGGKVNSFSPTETPVFQRNSAFFAWFQAYWTEAADDDMHINWVRDIYGQTFASTGGYPVPGDRYEGCQINSPDPDIFDDRYNQSGVAWPTFMFGDNYDRLQRAKCTWDPNDVFRHSFSIRLPD
ncbi:FAD-dependent oxidoreductase [Nocardia suismassiliense]|uniref:FAD-dependent oxidoreductase n=1 Tax=Nocardia suismassiliense TaxID=2077092 RepID=A0ABW6R441_9NOCA